MAQRLKCLPAMWETWVQSWVGKILWRRKWQPTPVFLPGESHGQRNLVGYSPWGRKESDMTEWLSHTHTLVITPRTTLQNWPEGIAAAMSWAAIPRRALPQSQELLSPNTELSSSAQNALPPDSCRVPSLGQPSAGFHSWAWSLQIKFSPGPWEP